VAKTIGIGMIGCGTVGGGVARLLHDMADTYTQRVGAPIALRRVLVRDPGKHRDALRGVSNAADLLTADADAFFATADMPIVVEVAGGRGVVSQYVRRALSMGKHVVTANKALLAAEGGELFKLAHENQAAIAFEASCAGGIPVITALQFGLMANRIQSLHGILNGTCNYILTEMTQKAKSYAVALKEAQDAGFAEADPTLDVSGGDAAAKLAILAALAFGVRIDADQVWTQGIDQLDLVDIKLGAELGYDIKLLGIAQHGQDGAVSVRVHPCFIDARTLLAQVHGPFNALLVSGHAVGQTLHVGRGAGELPTASAVVSDILNLASGWYAQAFARMRLWPDTQTPARMVSADDLVSRFYLRVNALDKPGVMAQITRILGEAGISLSAVMQHESAAGRMVPVVITTHAARQGAVQGSLQRIAGLDVIEGRPVCIRIADLPQG
jgi:homoserine dehydrogenase